MTLGRSYGASMRARQKGATLIVSLIILAVITILGLASMRSSNMELRMAASARDRAVAFQYAEAALVQVERNLVAEPFPITSFLPTCAGNRCFTSNCANGLCFSGDMENITYRDECRLVNTANTATFQNQHWQTTARWGAMPTVAVSRELANEEGNAAQVAVPYMIEFMCFTPRDDVSPDDENARNAGIPLYRITVRATGDAGRSSVMLQSVYRATR